MFVISKDNEQNTITVSSKAHIQETTEDMQLHSICLRQSIDSGEILEAQTRYRQEPFLVTVTHIDTDLLVITPKEPLQSPAKGQSCVLYRGPLCIGGGILR